MRAWERDLHPEPLSHFLVSDGVDPQVIEAALVAQEREEDPQALKNEWFRPPDRTFAIGQEEVGLHDERLPA